MKNAVSFLCNNLRYVFELMMQQEQDNDFALFEANTNLFSKHTSIR